jgi:ribosomal protein S25
VPVNSAIEKMIKKFRETGSLLDKNHNRQKSVLPPGILQDIQTAITRSPHISLWKLSAQTGISLGLAHTVVRKMLKFFTHTECRFFTS